jgi:hypothetical protein
MKFKFALAIALLSVTLIACKKDKDDDPTITGLWLGKYSSSSTSYPTLGYAFLFRKDGTVRVFNSSDTAAASGKAEGTYQVAGNKVTCNYTYVIGAGTYSSEAIVNSMFTFMEGSWGNGSSTTNGGMYFVYKN